MGQDRVGPAYKLFVALETYRRDNELTWDEMAKRSKTGRQTLTNLRDGKDKPRLKTVYKIADTIGLNRTKAEQLAGWRTVEELAAPETPTPQAPTPPTPPAADPHAGAVDAREAILRDPRLDEKQAAVLVATYDAIVRAFQPPGVPPRRSSAPTEGERRAS